MKPFFKMNLEMFMIGSDLTEPWVKTPQHFSV